MIGTTTAILGAAAIGAGATALGASKASKAANYAADQQAEAARETNALNERIYNQTRADNEPFRQVGVSAAGAVSHAFGLNPSMTGGSAPTYASTPVPGVGGVSMTNPRGTAGTSPLEPNDRAATTRYAADSFGSPVSMTDAKNAARVSEAARIDPRTGGTAAPPEGPDWDAYLQQNPDVLANAQQRVAEGSATSLQQVAQEHWVNFGKPENRALPMTASPLDAGYTPAEGYTDPTAPNGYGVGARPDVGAGPSPYVAPARMTASAPDLSYKQYAESPDFQFRVSQGNLALDHVASAGGGLMSGARVKGALRFNQDLASQGYTDWRNFTQGQANLDRSRNDSIYSEDRGFGYGQARDARGDFVTDRTRSDGLYADDRGFTTGRYDTRNNQLMTLAGFGPSANASNSSAATTFAQSTNAANQTAANARGDAAIAGANAWNQGVGNLMTTGAYLAGNYLSGGFGKTTPSLPKQYSI
jgi:hypothetical protein